MAVWSVPVPDSLFRQARSYATFTVDVNGEACEGQALDLLHGASILADQKITSGDMKSCSDSDCIVITAGLRRKPEESRLT